MEPLSVHDYERLAEERLDAGAYGYFTGGANDEVTLRENVDAFARLKLRPRLLVDVAACTTETTVLGHAVSMPLLVAPVAFQRVAHPDGEAGMARAAARAGTAMILSTLSTTSAAEVAAAAADALRFSQLYVFRDEGVTRALVEQARANGYSALVLTVDAPVVGRRERDHRTGFTIPSDIRVPALGRGDLTPKQAFDLMSASVTWRDVEQLVETCGLPVVVKGLLTAEDAELACAHGAAAIVVSNHGGRQLDGVAATIDALPEVVDAVAGRVEVWVDGGVRRGTDVVKALGLGARCVLAGRAPLFGLAVGGEAGALHVLELLRAEILLALQLVGCGSPADVTSAHVAGESSKP